MKNYRIKNSFYKRLFKVAFVLIISVAIKLLCSCEPSFYDVDLYYNQIDVKGIDGKRVFYSKAVALQLNLSDSLNNYYYASYLNSFAFKSAFADDQYPTYYPVNEVEDIRVITLLDIDKQLKAGDDITENILYAFEYDFDLYELKQAVISFINRTHSEPGCSVQLYLKIPVTNSQAQFRVNVTFSDGTLLSDTTHLFSIITL